MQIASIKLENAKSYQDALIEFTPGVNAIVGHNGAGKSTILEGIGLALFDHLHYTQSEFVRAGTRTATVTVTFESNLDQRLYEVVRRVGGTNVHYVHDPEIGTRLCEGKADVLAFLREHMGVESTADLSSLFRDAVGVAQGTFTAAFLGTPAQRKSVFDPLLQVDDYRKADELLRPPERLLDERRQTLDVTIAGLRARLEDLPRLEQVVAERERELSDAEKNAEEARSELEEAVARKGALEAVRTELAELRSEQSRLVERQQATVRELARARQAHADAEAAQETVQKNEAGYERHLAAQKQQKELDSQLRERQRLESARAHGDRSLAVAETRLEQLKQELSAIDEAAADMQKLEANVKHQNELESRLHQARQNVVRLQDVEAQVASQRARLEELSSRAQRLTSAMDRSAELESRSIELQVQEDKAAEAVEALRDENARLESEANALKKQTSALMDVESAVCPVCEQPLTDTHRRELIERNEVRVEELRTNYRGIQSQIASMREQSSGIQNELRQVEQERRELPRASEMEQLTKDLDAVEASLEQLLQQQHSLGGAGEQIIALENELAELGDPKRAYALARSQAERHEPVTKSIQETVEDMDKLQRDLDGIQEELARFENLDAEMDACSEAMRESEEAYRLVLSNRRLAEAFEAKANAVEQLQSTEKSLVAEMETLTGRIEDTSARFDDAAYAEVASREQTLRAQLGALDARMEMMRKQQEADRASIVELKGLQTSLADSEEQLGQIREQAEVMDTIRKLLRRAGPYVTSVLIRQVSDNARQIFGDIMQDFTRHLSWNDDYGVTLEVDGHERDFSQLSGGEQMTAALAVRLALLRELSSIDVAFFDEPTANLDESRRDSLARQILEVKGFRQLFVISHDDTFEQATQNLIRVERRGDTSEVTVG